MLLRTMYADCVGRVEQIASSSPHRAQSSSRVRSRWRGTFLFVYRLYQAMQLSNPSAIFFPGRLRPMKTMRLSRFSPLFQGR